MVDAPNKKVKYPVRITVLESDLPAHMVLCRHTDLSVGRLPGPNWRQRPGRPHAQWTDQIRWDSSSSLVDLWRCAIRHGHAARATQWPLLATWHWRWWWISLSALQDKGATFISILCEVTSRRYFCVFFIPASLLGDRTQDYSSTLITSGTHNLSVTSLMTNQCTTMPCWIPIPDIPPFITFIILYRHRQCAH